MGGPYLRDVHGVRQPVEAWRVVVDVPDKDVHRVFDHLWRRWEQRVSNKFHFICVALNHRYSLKMLNRTSIYDTP